MLKINNNDELAAALDLITQEVEVSKFLELHSPLVGIPAGQDIGSILSSAWGIEFISTAQKSSKPISWGISVPKSVLLDEIEEYLFPNLFNLRKSISSSQVDVIISQVEQAAIQASEAIAHFDTGEGLQDYSDPRAMTCEAAAKILSQIAKSNNVDDNQRVAAVRALLNAANINLIELANESPTKTTSENQSRIVIAGFYMRNLSSIYRASPNFAVLVSKVAADTLSADNSSDLSALLAIDISTLVDLNTDNFNRDFQWVEREEEIHNNLGVLTSDSNVNPTFYYLTQVGRLLTSDDEEAHHIEAMLNRMFGRNVEQLRAAAVPYIQRQIDYLSQGIPSEKFGGLTRHADQLLVAIRPTGNGRGQTGWSNPNP